MDTKAKPNLFIVWAVLFLAFTFLSFQYFQGAINWPIHNYNQQIQTTVYANGHTTFLDSHGKVLPISSKPTSSIPSAIIKWGLAAAAAFCLWKAVGVPAGSRRAHLALFIAVALVLLAITSFIFFRYFFLNN